MDGLKEEWLIWDRRFQNGYNSLEQRLKINEEATGRVLHLDLETKQRAAAINKHLQDETDGVKHRIQLLERALSQMVQLDEQVRDLTASNRDLKDKILLLEREGTHRDKENNRFKDRVMQLDEQVQDLTASGRDLKEDNNELKDRTLQLEREGTHRDEENSRLKYRVLQLERGCTRRDEENDGLKDRILQLEQEGSRRDELIQLVDERLEGKLEDQDDGLKGTQLEKMSEMASLKSEPYARASLTFGIASSEASEPTTEEGRTLIQQQLQPNAANEDVEVLGVLIKAQAPSTRLEDHLRYSGQAFTRYETEAVRAFVNGLQHEYRIPLYNKLDEHGEWTWQAAQEEGHRLVEARKKKRMRWSSRLMNRPSQPS
ncbi:hypothetical protein IMSHALPRED_006933 [Imshaugia aleurites]|uniref:Uncharacterized protein n=1 Tax=Imshaugia aleurites TaxID=172621 RepID=A0A8H3FS65_9LECA|nr:hypothetical protein IMSHALPRED_006933 [Imshaugia aleurites]